MDVYMHVKKKISTWKLNSSRAKRWHTSVDFMQILLNFKHADCHGFSATSRAKINCPAQASKFDGSLHKQRTQVNAHIHTYVYMFVFICAQK